MRSQQRFREGFAEQVADEFLQAHFGAEYRDSIERVLPGSFAQAVADAATSFELDMPGLLGWSFGEAEARRITRPVLAVLGSQSNALWPRFGETHRLLLEWLPQVQGFVLPGAAHGLQMQHPQGMAEAIADFWAHHPIRLA